MAPAVLTPVSDEKRQLERQMGCMAGFLQLFDRHQRIYTPRRLNFSGPTSPSERSEISSAFPSSPENSPERTPLLDSWKLREAPRLSLDSRLRPREHRPIPPQASETEVGKSRRPPSIVARLMGVDALPELRRSASESRASRDPYRSVDRIVFQKPPDLVVESRSKPPPPPLRSAATRKSFFDAHDFFPDPNKLRLHGIDEPAKDLETLKLILEASQLKGLLHSRRSQNSNNVRTNRNPPIVVLKPDPKPARRSDPGKGIRNPNQRVRSPPPKPSQRKASSNVRSVRNQRSTDDVSPKEIRIRSPSPKLLERCDELLRSIAAFTSLEQQQQQPSPVSVLDSAFLGEESSPSPSAKRSIWEEERWSPPPAAAVGFDVPESDARDFGYVYDILRFSDRRDGLDEVYSLLEKRHGATDASESAVLHRRLMFDTVAEILVRKRHVSAWEAFSVRRRTAFGKGGEQLIREVWLEVRRTREGVAAAAAANDLDEVTCGAIRKDLGGGDHGWGDTSAETSDAIVLNIERLVFKELVEETIRGLADVAGGKSVKPFRRKLVF